MSQLTEVFWASNALDLVSSSIIILLLQYIGCSQSYNYIYTMLRIFLVVQKPLL